MTEDIIDSNELKATIHTLMTTCDMNTRLIDSFEKDEIDKESLLELMRSVKTLLKHSTEELINYHFPNSPKNQLLD